MARAAIDLSFLDDLEVQVNDVVGRAITECAGDALAVALRLVPRKTGNLARNTGLQRTGATRWLLYADTEYASFVENGRPAIHASPGKVLRFVINGTVLFRKSVGPAAAHPFLQPAADWFEANVDRYIDRATG